MHESVAEVVVIGVPDENLGEAVRAYVVLKQTNVTEEELMHYCTLHLAKYKVPKSIEFLTELPKNTTGKLLRRALREKRCKFKYRATIFMKMVAFLFLALVKLWCHIFKP